MKPKDVTCVLNAHKESHYVHPTIQSMERAAEYARSCGLDVEMVAVLDNSDASTVEIVRRDAPSSMRVETVNYGDVAHARNHAVRCATGRYTAFVDGDDLWGKSWLTDAYIMAEGEKRDLILHPQYNVYYGNGQEYVMQHLDMESRVFSEDFMYERNYWTALSFARTDIFRRFPYRENVVRDGFAYEDWTWNFETARSGIVHKIVPSTAHFIRRGKGQMGLPSVLDSANGNQSLPRVLDIYRRREVASSEQRPAA